jgi:integral membrane protein (TIGR01906 family)
MFINSKFTKIRKIIILADVILLLIIILFTPLAYYIFNLNYYKSLYEKNGVFNILNREDAINVTEKIFNFFKYRSDLDYKDPELEVRYNETGKNEFFSFTENELSHLYDVRALLKKIFILYYVCLALFFVFTIMLLRKNTVNFIYDIGIVFTASSILIVIFAFILYLSVKNFPVLFNNFHEIFFPQGNYTFYEGSLLITIFPAGFFYDFFVRLVTGSGIISLILMIAGIVIIFICGFIKKRKYPV